MGNEIQTVILINNSNPTFITYLQEVLEENQIPSVHISSTSKIPRPIGLRVRSDDYESALLILEELNPGIEEVMEIPGKQNELSALGCLTNSVFLLAISIGIPVVSGKLGGYIPH